MKDIDLEQKIVQMSHILTDLNKRIELCKTLAPRKLYTQQKLNSLAKKYNEKNIL